MDYTSLVANSQDEPDPFRALEPDMPKLVQPIRVQVRGEVLDMGTPKFIDAEKSTGHVTIDFSQM